MSLCFAGDTISFFGMLPYFVASPAEILFKPLETDLYPTLSGALVSNPLFHLAPIRQINCKSDPTSPQIFYRVQPPPLNCHTASPPSHFSHVEQFQIPSTLNLSHCQTFLCIAPPPLASGLYSLFMHLYPVSQTQGTLTELGVTQHMLLLCMTEVLPKVNVELCYLLSLILNPTFFFIMAKECQSDRSFYPFTYLL